MVDDTSLTVRFSDVGGARASMWAVAGALDTVAAPRAVADDVRLAVEIALDRALTEPSTDGGSIVALAATAGRIALEVRTHRPSAVDPTHVVALVDEVELRRDADAVVVSMSRSWTTEDRPAD